MLRCFSFLFLVVLDKLGALLGHRDERRHVVIDQGLLERRQVAESMNLGHAVLAQRALRYVAVQCGGVW